MKKINTTILIILAVLTLCVLSANAQSVVTCNVNPPTPTDRKQSKAVSAPTAVQSITGHVATNFVVPVHNARVTLMKQSVLGAARCFAYTDTDGAFTMNSIGINESYILTIEYPRYLQFFVDTRTFQQGSQPLEYFLFLGTVDDSNWQNQ